MTRFSIWKFFPAILFSYFCEVQLVGAQMFDDRPTFAYRIGVDGKIQGTEATFLRYRFFSPNIDVALLSAVHNRFGLSEVDKKRIQEAEKVYFSKSTLFSVGGNNIDIDKMRKKQTLGADLELAIRECLSEKQLKECTAIDNFYIFYDSGPAHWAESFGATDSEIEEVKVSASYAAESLRKELLDIEKEATSKLLSCLSPNVSAEISKLLYPDVVSVYPTPTLLYDSLTNQGHFAGLEDKPVRIPGLKLSNICTLEATDLFTYSNRYALEFDELVHSSGSLELSNAQLKELTAIWQSLRLNNSKRTKEEDFLFYQTGFEKALKILTPEQQLEFNRRQLMGRIRREGLIPSLSTAPANLGPLLKLDSKQVQKLKDTKGAACEHIKDRMLLVQKKYVELVFANLPEMLRVKLKSKLEWETAITAQTVPPLEILLFHCERYE